MLGIAEARSVNKARRWMGFEAVCLRGREEKHET